MKQTKLDIKTIYMALRNKQVLQSSIAFNYDFIREKMLATLKVYYNTEFYHFSVTYGVSQNVSIVDAEEKDMVRMFSKLLTSLYAIEVGLPNDGDLLKHSTPVTVMLKQNGYLFNTPSGGVAVNTRNVNTLAEISKIANIFGYAIIPQIDINKYRYDYEEAFERLVNRYGRNLPPHVLEFTIQRIS